MKREEKLKSLEREQLEIHKVLDNLFREQVRCIQMNETYPQDYHSRLSALTALHNEVFNTMTTIKGVMAREVHGIFFG